MCLHVSIPHRKIQSRNSMCESHLMASVHYMLIYLALSDRVCKMDAWCLKAAKLLKIIQIIHNLRSAKATYPEIFLHQMPRIVLKLPLLGINTPVGLGSKAK